MSKSNFVYNLAPSIHKARSRFDMSHSHKTSINEGALVPFYVQEVYPGDSFNVKTSHVIRSSVPFIRPIMDNLFLDMYYFFVPNRLVYQDWQYFMGENKDGYWTNTVNYTIPYTNAAGVAANTIGDYMGIPVNNNLTADDKINVMPFRAYAKIWNEWFRDENTQQPCKIYTDSTYHSQEACNNNSFGVNNYCGKPAYINKFHDYFTSCLPAPQKGNDVLIPLEDAGIFTRSTRIVPDVPLTWANVQSGSALSVSGPLQYNAIGGGSTITTGTVSASTYIAPDNLYVKGKDLGGTINDLRFAMQFQRLLEMDARGGTRYVEYLLEHFGVVSPDARLQRPEFLGGKRMPLNVSQVAQTSASTTDSPLGQVGAYSLSSNECGFVKGFVEHGYIIGVCAVRQHHTYQQGLEKFWTRKTRYDFYDPVFANIGEQPVYKYELDAVHNNTVSGAVFGYNEAWADLRYRPSRVSGSLRSSSLEGLDIWHLADNYANSPTLNSDFMKETSTYLDRTLSAGSSTISNFIVDIYNDIKAVRVLPVRSIPGKIDHN
ncbi:major capsid protein [Capybara microvirus Cap3_SP_478]|nr:major capsid protein [Capybara microvirus Cap3_SP_478]